MKATAKFVGFVRTFGTEPPPDRPDAAWAQVDWSRIHRYANQVYGHRSNILHAGEPIPVPMLEVPWEGNLGVPAEKPTGLGTSFGDCTWGAADTPMHLHAFAGLARRSILAWWRSVATAP